MKVRHGPILGFPHLHPIFELENGVNGSRGGLELFGAVLENLNQSTAGSDWHVIQTTAGTTGNVVVYLAEVIFGRRLGDLFATGGHGGFYDRRFGHMLTIYKSSIRQQVNGFYLDFSHQGTVVSLWRSLAPCLDLQHMITHVMEHLWNNRLNGCVAMAFLRFCGKRNRRRSS
jgi:hypothetical protein